MPYWLIIPSILFLIIAIIFMFCISKGPLYSLDKLEIPIHAILKRGYNGGFLVIQPIGSRFFLQFSKYILKKGIYGIELNFPKVSWSEQYYEELIKYCKEKGLLYKRQITDSKSEFINIDLNQDIEKANLLTRHIFCEILQIDKNTRYSVLLENSHLFDELVDSPERQETEVSNKTALIRSWNGIKQVIKKKNGGERNVPGK